MGRGSLLFLAAGAYYAYEQSTQQYVVVQPPAQVPSPQPAPQGNGYDVVAYPANGQSPAQVQQDGYDCYRWAAQQSGFDPRTVTYARTRRWCKPTARPRATAWAVVGIRCSTRFCCR